MKKGFTLIELLVVIAIIGVLASMVMSSLNDARARARDAKRIADIRSIQNALELYHLDNGSYPERTISGFCATLPLSTSLVDNGYLSILPTDPLSGRSTGTSLCYNYSSQPNHTSVSAWLCDGTTRTEYEYAFVLQLEKPNTNIPEVAHSGGGNIGEFTHCILGPKI